MKQELTIAFCLLAAGAAWWSWQAGVLPTAAARAQTAAASAVTHAGDAAGLEVPIDAAFIDLTPQPAAAFQARENDAQSELLLRRAQHMIDQGPAFESQVTVQAVLFGQKVVGSGSYLQSGQGSGRTRSAMTFYRRGEPAKDAKTETVPAFVAAQQLLHVSDGRFVYRLQHDLASDTRNLEFYDGLQLRNASNRREPTGSEGSDGPTADPISDPPLAPARTGGLMTLGLASLLQQLVADFQFLPSEKSIAGTKQWTLRGTWKPQRLRQMLSGQLSDKEFQQGVAWSQLPPQLPHAVEIKLTQTPTLEIFPSNVTFYQFQTRDDRATAQPYVSFRFETPRPLPTVSDDLFVIQNQNLEATDMTQQYLSRLQTPAGAVPQLR